MKKLRTRIASTILAAALLLTILPAYALALDGQGTPEDPYQVGTADDLKAAFEAGGSIRLTDDFTVDATATTQLSKAVALDLNGCTLTWNTSAKNGVQVLSGGSLTVCDNSADSDGELKIVNTSTSAGVGINISTGGALTLQSGTISADIAKTSSYVVYASGSFTMSGGTIALDGSATNGLYLSGNDDAPSSLANGTIEFRNKENGTLNGVNTYRTTTISNMTVDASAVNASSTARAIYNNCSSTSDRTVTINGGTYSVNGSSTKSYAVAGSNNKKAYIEGGTFNGVVQTASGLISGGSFSVEPASQYAVSGKVFQLDTSDNYYKLVDGSYVGRIGNVGYLSWDELFAACGDLSSATTVYPMSDAESITIPADKNVKLQNMSKVTVGSLINNGTCEIYLYALPGAQVTNNGTLKLSHEVGSLVNNTGGTVTTGSSAVVTGDVTNHGAMTISYGKYLGKVANDGNLTITGGSYRSSDGITVQDTENYGFYKIQDSDYGDLYAVYEKTAVQAQVGEYYYTKWNTAALKGTAQQPAKLLTDLTLSPNATSPLNINSGSDYYLDLNGHTMNLQGANSAYNYGFKISKGSLNLYNSQPESGGIVFTSYNNNGDGVAFWIGGRMNDDGPDASVLRVAQGVKITSDAYSINMMTKGATDKYGVAVYFDGVLETLYGPYVNGQYDNMVGSVPVFNFLEHSEINAQSTGLYAAGYAQWNLAGGITSERAEPLSIKSGMFNITGGTYTASGAYHDPADTNNNGSEATGAALSITSNDGYAKKINVTVTGGTFISKNGHALYEGIAKNSSGTSAAAESYAVLSISGGDFRGAQEKDAVNITEAANKKVISGGTFNSEPNSAYLVDGYAATDENGVYTVLKENEYKVTFDANAQDATVNPAYSITSSGKLTVLPVPVREGYRFEGWFDAAEGGTQVTGETNFAKNTTIYAHWTKVYTVTVTSDGSGASGSGSYAESDFVAINAGTRDGYTFSGWTSSDNVTFASASSAETAFAMPAKDVTVTANWTKNSGGSGGGGSSSGSSGSSGNKTETTTNDDGSTTTTVTKPDGSTIETTTNTDGSKEVVETAKDGTVTTTTTDTDGNQTEKVEDPNGTTTTTMTDTDGNKAETVENPDGTAVTNVEMANGSTSTTTVDENGLVNARVALHADVVSEAQQTGETIALPIPAVASSTDVESAPVVVVDLASADASAKVEIPVADVTPGTVAVRMLEDGSQEIVKTAIPTENGLALTVSHGDTVKIVDNAKDFADVADSYWGADEISFAASRELMSGTSATTFTPEGDMTRAMVVTVLARYEGVDTSTGDTWYDAGRDWAMQNGVSDGSNMQGSVTREQLAAMLYRYAGEPEVSGTIDGFHDAGAISDWAQDAMVWAIQNGLIGGMGDGVLNPQGTATRAQVATILTRFVALTA